MLEDAISEMSYDVYRSPAWREAGDLCFDARFIKLDPLREDT